MKKLSDLKPNEAIRVSRDEWPKLAELLDKEGHEWVNGQNFKEITPWNADCESDAENTVYLFIEYGRFYWRNDNDFMVKDPVIIPASDFLQPEPKLNQELIEKLRKGEVILWNNEYKMDLIAAILKKAFPDDHSCLGTPEDYYYSRNERYWSNDDENTKGALAYPASKFIEPENGSVIESATMTGVAEQYEIGQHYEFSNGLNKWHKAKLLAIVDHAGKYIVEREDEDWPLSFMYIREIKPRKIIKWIMYDKVKDTFFGKPKNNEQECLQAGNSAPIGYEPIKLEGIC